MIRVIILDVDGTLMDTNYLHVEAWARAFLAIGISIPRAEIHRQIGKGSELMLEELLISSSLKKRLSEIKDMHSHFYEDMQEHGTPLPGAKELLVHLSSIPKNIWLATSAKSEELDHHLEQLDAHDKLTGIVSSDDVEKAKPAPDIFQQALEQASASAEESIVVGDTIWDIQAAQGCGLQTVAVMTGGAFSRQELKEEGAVAVIKDCSELLSAGFPDSFPDTN